ncbi:Cytoplasmic dynein 1 light intermediate chain 2 [Paragonimus heterotremus]|uniref:Dynein light intermediate chain n=1 Tax=Paragonimus heterotremus TaxID=100268 RepID=A0A8J4SQQ6_9TREM|nr:Cytoplasmic dynein 1 light intermediate chain 2 [Paragonimus heterotremus]
MRPTEIVSLDDPPDEITNEDGKCLWSSILKEVTHKASCKLSSARALVVLGDDGSGKTTLITKLQGSEDPKESFGLEYTFIDIKDEDRDDQTKLNVWVLDSDVVHKRLLKFALNEENFGECVAMLVVSMAEPWKIMESLEKWSDLLEKHIKSLPIPIETISEYKSGLVRQFREYVEPDALLPPPTPAPISHVPLATAPINVHRTKSQLLHPATAALLSSTLLAAQSTDQSTTSATQGDSVTTTENGDQNTINELPLDPTTLSENLGIPIVVVVTKTDVMNTLEKEERFTEEHFDYIQMHIRRFCLKYGAALFYVSVKVDKHCDLLNRYLQSRIYGFPFTQAAYVVERDCVFVPTGWDSEKKIAILEENFTQIRGSDPYNDVIPRPPPRRSTDREPEMVAQDEQSFLTHLLAKVQREASATGANAPGGGPTSEAMLEQLASAAALLTQDGSGSPAVGQRQNMGSPRTPSSGMRAKVGLLLF